MTGSWVERRLGVRLATTSSAVGLHLHDLVGMAVRRNPRRAHLLVSTVLGKHIPVDPRLVIATGQLLGLLARDALENNDTDRHALGDAIRAALSDATRTSAAAARDAVADAIGEAGTEPIGHAPPVVMAYAETAVSLGDTVAAALPGADQIHSTRRHVVGIDPLAVFSEDHSHARDHLVSPCDPTALLDTERTLVLVDDELSTGRTVLNTIRVLHALAPRRRYVAAVLVDMRTESDAERLRAEVEDLGAELQVVALVRGSIELPDGVGAAASALAERHRSRTSAARAGRCDAAVSSVEDLPRVTPAVWPADQPESARHGLNSSQSRGLRRAARDLATGLRIEPGTLLHVLGTEEFMTAPLHLAAAIADANPEVDVRYSSTTRSPAVVIDEPGYALRSAVEFAAPEPVSQLDTDRRFAYNVSGDSHVLVLVDAPAGGERIHAPGGLLDVLVDTRAAVRCHALPTVMPAVPPTLHGPAFGSYGEDEVAWLLTDLSGHRLEAATGDREALIQSGAAHYAESLPIELQPDAEYLELFHACLAESAARVATAVGAVAEIVLAERGRQIALASLARAGTPIGVLIRRWLQHVHGIEARHYTLSIVRGRGIDTLALRALAQRHDPADVVFVDGWTGKGAIVRELSAALAEYHAQTGVRFDDRLAVLADPGECVTVFGTREDFLIPSACLNSTVSGLVSRTVLNAQLTGPGQFHGAKFYAELADQDVSTIYLDAISAHFDDVHDDSLRAAARIADGPREPTWAGWTAVERISERYGIGEVNLVKPGVGETTRVLLRRVPDRVLVRRGAAPDLPHVLSLARRRGVPVEEVDDLPYSCVGLIQPHAGGES